MPGETAVKVSAYFLRQSDPRFLDDAKDEGDDINDEAVSGRDQADFDSSPDDALGDIPL